MSPEASLSGQDRTSGVLRAGTGVRLCVDGKSSVSADFGAVEVADCNR